MLSKAEMKHFSTVLNHIAKENVCTRYSTEDTGYKISFAHHSGYQLRLWQGNNQAVA